MRHSLLAAAALLLAAVATATSEQATVRSEEAALALQPTSIDKGRKGLKAIEELLKIFTSDIFDDKEFGQVMDIFSKTLSFVGAFLGLFGGGGESAEMKFLREQFARLHARLDNIQLQLGDVKNLIDWTGTRMMYHDLERHILTSSRLFDDYMKAANDRDRGFYKRRFVDHYQQKRQAAFDLYQAVAEADYVIGKNLAAAVIHFTQNHRPKVMSFLLDISRLVLRGAQMQIAYERMQHSEKDALQMENAWKGRMEKLTRKLKEANDRVKGAYHSQLQTDTQRLINEGRNDQNKDFVGRVYRFVADKFPWRYWIVLAYKNVGGWDNHAITHCGSAVYFRTAGDRNVVVASSDKKGTRFNRANAERVLAAVDGTVRNRNAKEFLDAINGRVGNYCHSAALRAAVCWGCDVWFISINNRRVYRKMTAQRGGNMNTLLFG